MVNLLIFALICYGASNIIVFGSIFESWRVFWLKNNEHFIGKLFTCMICISFWVGVLISYFIYSPVIINNLTSGNIAHFLDGCLASGIVWLLHTLQEYLEK